MGYWILLAPPAERQFKAFPQAVQKRLVQRLKTLQANPRPQGVKKLAGEDDLYRLLEGKLSHYIRDPRQGTHCPGP